MHLAQDVLDLSGACLVSHLEGGLAIELLPIHLRHIAQEHTPEEESVSFVQKAPAQLHGVHQVCLLLYQGGHAAIETLPNCEQSALLFLLCGLRQDIDATLKCLDSLGHFSLPLQEVCMF